MEVESDRVRIYIKESSPPMDHGPLPWSGDSEWT